MSTQNHNIQDQLTRAGLHLSKYKFEPHLWAPCLSLQSLPHHDGYQSAKDKEKKVT